MLEWALGALTLDPLTKLFLAVVVYQLWTIKRNHLPHIYNKLSELNREVGVLIGKDSRKGRS